MTNAVWTATLSRLFTASLALSFFCVSAQPESAPLPESGDTPSAAPRIAIIIDDLGYKLHEGKQSIALPHPITLAIIPDSPHAQRLAEAANCEKDKEILVHLPMEPSNKIPWENGLNASMDEEAFSLAASTMLKQIPYAIGANNHGGSLLTQDEERMAWLMKVLHTHTLFFIDSRTTPASVAVEAAQHAQIPFSSRDIFLDNVRDKAAIDAQLDKLVALANQHGQAVAIGHPYSETLAVLNERLGEIQAQGINLVGVSEILSTENELAAKTDAETAKAEL